MSDHDRAADVCKLAKVFTDICVEDIGFRDLEIRIEGRGSETRDVPILSSLANEIRLYLGDRLTGPIFPSSRGGTYSKRRIQQFLWHEHAQTTQVYYEPKRAHVKACFAEVISERG